MRDQNGYLPLLPRQREVQARIDAANRDPTLAHVCPVGGPMMIGHERPCDLCGGTRHSDTVAVLPSLLKKQAD